MRIRLLKPLNYRRVGTVLEVGDGVGELWIKSRKAERVKPDPTATTTMVPPRQVEVEVGVSGRRGRPRKQTA